jgi:hypothetical protein
MHADALRCLLSFACARRCLGFLWLRMPQRAIYISSTARLPRESANDAYCGPEAA